MISIKRIEPRTYEDVFEEALTQIPLYSKEWTNFNPSDPGITILENLTAFNMVQQNHMNEPAAGVKEKLLKLVGFEKKPGKCARVLLQAEGAEEDFYLPSGQKFKVGDVNFETGRKSVVYANKIKNIVSECGDQLIKCDSLLDKTVSVNIKAFGTRPKAGDAMYLFFEKMPSAGSDLIFYFDVADSNKRAGGESQRKSNDFAKIEWQYYTESGFVSIKAKDSTRSFLTGGEIRFSIPDSKGAEYELDEYKGYCIRAVLKRAEYDIAPKFSGIYGFLFEVWQKETRSMCHTMRKASPIEVYCDLFEDDYLMVFCKEGKEDYYHLYKEADMKGIKGRYYEKERLAFGRFDFYLSKQKFGFGPNSDNDAVKIVAYNEDMMRRYELDQVYGYDDQEIELPEKNIVAESFCVIAEVTASDGEMRYYFVKPDRTKDGDLNYILDEREGKMIIKDAGDFVGSTLYLGSLAVSLGEQGNVRSGNEFVPIGYETEIKFTNPVMGEGGRLKESLTEVQKRFVEDLSRPYVAVKEQDYEQLVKETPDLCIQKVRALAKHETNDVQIVCKPYSDELTPTLSDTYIKKIMAYMEDRRILSTGIEIIQPVYVPIDVSGTIYVKKHYENCKEEIEKVINKHLDYVNGKQQFGDVLKFDSLFRDIEDLPCVEYVFELSIYPENNRYARMFGLDVQIADNALCIPGQYYFEVNTYID